MSALQTAFLEANFNWASTLRSVWNREAEDDADIQKDVVDRIIRSFAALRAPDAENIVGQPINGAAGSGKTHLIGTLRRRVWAEHGWFVLIEIVGITDFWRTAAFGFIKSLRQSMPNGRSQYQAVFEQAVALVPRERMREAIQASSATGSGAVDSINIFVRALQKEFADAVEHGNVIRALLLQGDPESAEIAYGWLQGLDIDSADRRAVGLNGPSPPPEKIVAGVSWLMSLSGPTMIAIDQIDAIVTAGNIIADKTTEVDDETEARARSIVHLLAAGLMDLYDVTKRSMTIVTSLVETWEIIRAKALQTARDRFNISSIELESRRNDRAALERLVAARLRPAFARHDVTPPYPTWPFTPEALAGLEGAWPRRVLMACEAYRQTCDHSAVQECTSLTDERPPSTASPIDLAKTFDDFRDHAVIGDLANILDDGGLLGQCLRETLDFYLRQITIPDSVDALISSPTSDARPALHAV